MPHHARNDVLLNKKFYVEHDDDDSLIVSRIVASVTKTRKTRTAVSKARVGKAAVAKENASSVAIANIFLVNSKRHLRLKSGDGKPDS
jgi:hypothetical protein